MRYNTITRSHETEYNESDAGHNIICMWHEQSGNELKPAVMERAILLTIL